MKLIIDIPKRIYDVIKIRSEVMTSELHQAVLKGIPIEKITEEIEQEHDGCVGCVYEDSKNMSKCGICKQNYMDMWESAK